MAQQHKTALERARDIAEYWNTHRVDTPWLVRAIHTAILEATNEVTLRAQAQENELNQAHCEKLLLRNECARLRDLAQELLQFIEDVHGEAPPHIQQLVDAVFPPDEGTARQHAAPRAAGPGRIRDAVPAMRGAPANREEHQRSAGKDAV